MTAELDLVDKSEEKNFANVVSENKLMLGVFLAIFAIPCTLLGTFLERSFFSQSAEITADFVVYRHFSQSREISFDNVWIAKITNEADYAANDIVVELPMKGYARIKEPRKKEYEVKIEEAGISFNELRKNESIEVIIWSDKGYGEVDTSQINVTHPKGDAEVSVEDIVSDLKNSLNFTTGWIFILIFVMILLAILWRKEVNFSKRISTAA